MLNFKRLIHLIWILILILSCSKDESNSEIIVFENPKKVNIIGYNGQIMEPFISKDGTTLFFNNLNEASENTNLHWAEKINDTLFQYNGEIAGVNTLYLEGVPTMDSVGNFFFVSTRNYSTTLSTLFWGQYNYGTISNVELIQGLSKMQAGWLNFDIEVSADGQNLYFVDAQFDQNGIPISTDIVIASKNISGFERITNSSDILKNVNTNALEYAACISNNQLELYFTRFSTPVEANKPPEIYYSTRKSTIEPFNLPKKIQNLSGFIEAPTITNDQKKIYFHKKENNLHVLYMIEKK